MPLLIPVKARRLPCAAVWFAAALAGPATGAPAAAQQRPGVDTAFACDADETPRQCYDRALILAVDSAPAARGWGRTERGAGIQEEALGLMFAACSEGLGDACYGAGRLILTSGFGSTAEEKRAAGLFDRGCYRSSNLSGAACNGLADAYHYGRGRPRDADRALQVFQRGCDIGHANACFRAASRYEDMRELGRERHVRKETTARRSCELGSDAGCNTWATALETRLERLPAAMGGAPRTVALRDSIVTLYRRTCGTRTDMHACINLGGAFEQGALGLAVRGDSAAHYFSLACDSASGAAGLPFADVSRERETTGAGCARLGDLLVDGLVPPDTAQAVELFRTACALHQLDACGRFAFVDDDRTEPRHTSAEHLYVAATSCYASEAWGCYVAGWFLERRFNDAFAADPFYQRACSSGEGTGCLEAGTSRNVADDPRLSRMYDPRQALRYFRLACAAEYEQGCARVRALTSSHFGLGQRTPGPTTRPRGPSSAPHAFPMGGKKLRRFTHSARAVPRCGWVTPTFTPNDPRDAFGDNPRGEESPYHLFTFTGRAGERVGIRMGSVRVDPFVQLGRVRDGVWTVIAQNNNLSTTTRNARISITLPADGEYLIRAMNTGSARRFGPYTLRVAIGCPEPASEPVTRRVRAGEDVTGTLGEGDAVLGDGSRHQHWVYEAQPGTRTKITLHSEEFDRYLVIGRMEDGVFEPFASSHGGAEQGSKSSVVVFAHRGGEYVIRVNTFGPAAHGAYTLRVERDP